MEQILKANIFFFITSVAVMVLSVIAAVFLIYIIRILRDVKDISGRIRSESAMLAEDIAALRANVRNKGMKLRHIIGLIQNIRERTKRTRSAKKDKKST
jgi:Skp family chaperone for outer membrane proteins